MGPSGSVMNNIYIKVGTVIQDTLTGVMSGIFIISLLRKQKQLLSIKTDANNSANITELHAYLHA